MKWISVKNRLPKQEQNVFCYNDDGEFFTAIYERLTTRYEPGYMDRWESGHCCGREKKEPTYWMALPKPPKKEDE